MEASRGGSERGWASIVHLAAFIGLAFPFGNVLGPLVIWLLKRDESALLDHHGREAVNFQISLVVFLLALSVLGVVSIALEVLAAFVALMVATAAAVIAALVVVIIAAVRANRGERFRYPLSIRWISGSAAEPSP